MFFIKKLITPFLLPPGIFVIAAAGFGALVFKRTRRGAWACFAFSALMWICSTAPFADFVFYGIENAYAVPYDLKADAVVVLGGGVLENFPAVSAADSAIGPRQASVSAAERLQPSSLARLSAAAEVYRKTHLPVLVSGGSPFLNDSEAAAGKLYLVESGVPPEAVITEENARDTYENAVFSKKICDEKGYKKILLLTSAYHMRRAVLSFKKAGFGQIVPLPVARVTRPGRRYYFKDYLPGSGDPAKALNERLGLLFYRMQFFISAADSARGRGNRDAVNPFPTAEGTPRAVSPPVANLPERVPPRPPEADSVTAGQKR